MEFWDVVESRHSIRDYRSEPIARETIQRVVGAGLLAPSSFNSQPWRYHVTTGDARRAMGEILSQGTVHLAEYVEILGEEQYEKAVSWFSSLGGAPVVIVVSCPTDGADAVNKHLSLGASIENVLLAATAEGLGTCCITSAWWVREEIASLLELGPDREVIALIAVGHPGDAPPEHSEKRAAAIDWLD